MYMPIKMIEVITVDVSFTDAPIDSKMFQDSGSS